MKRPQVIIDTDKCVSNIGNRFDLVLVAAQRVRELRKGHRAKVESRSTTIVTALEEIEAGKIDRSLLKKIK